MIRTAESRISDKSLYPRRPYDEVYYISRILKLVIHFDDARCHNAPIILPEDGPLRAETCYSDV